MRRFIVWAIGIGIIIILLGWAITLENATIHVFEEVEASVIKIELKKELVPICACESTGNKYGKPTHFDKDGNVLLGVINPYDTGMCQINVKIHKDTIERLGLDVTKEIDNIIFANWLYERDGSTPWNWSKPCWK